MAKKIDKRRGPQRRMETMVVAEEAAQYGIKAPKALPPRDKYISPNQAAKIINVTGECVKQWIYHRRLPATKLSNGYWKIRVGDFEEFIKARQNTGVKRIMIVDTGDTKNLVKAIEDLGHNAIVSSNKADALLKAADLYPSLFIVNVSAKELQPWKLLERIRNSRNIRNAPILITTDRDLSDKQSELALDLSVQGLLCRPFTAQDVVKEIERIVSRIL